VTVALQNGRGKKKRLFFLFWGNCQLEYISAFPADADVVATLLALQADIYSIFVADLYLSREKKFRNTSGPTKRGRW